MDRIREFRKVATGAAGNGLSRRRHRVGNFRDFTEEESQVELAETARLRDRGGSSKKDRDQERDRDIERKRGRDRERDRLNNRSKRRREERLMMVRCNLDNGGDDSSDESVTDDEEYEDRGVGPPSSLKMLPPTSNNLSSSSFSSSLSTHRNGGGGNGNLRHHNNHLSNHQKKNFPPAKLFRSSPSPAPPAPVSPLVSSWKAADEMIGVSVPRKARSACTKRPHESWTSSTTGGGGFATGEQIHRQVSSSPANRVSPTSILASPSPPAPTSPSLSSDTFRRKMSSEKKQKPLPPNSSSCKLPSPVAVQDEIEIEIAEVLYGMMRMPLTTSKQESAGNDSTDVGAKATVEVKPRISSPSSDPQTVPLSSIAPKRKKPRQVKYEDENDSRATINSEGESPSKIQVRLGDQIKSLGSAEESSPVLDSANPQPRESNASLDSRSTKEKENNLSKEETVLQNVESSSGFRSDVDGVTALGANSNSPGRQKPEIDLMAPPPGRCSSERGCEKMECVAAEAKPKVTEVETEAKPLFKEGEGDVTILEPEERKKYRTLAEADSHKLERNCELKLDLDKSDHVGLVNKHHVQKQQPQQQLSLPDKTALISALPLHMKMPGWPGGLPTMGYMGQTQGVVPTDTSSLSSAVAQPPPHLLFNQTRPKRCATHCYIARNIQSHQQFTKMNPYWPSAAGSAPLCGTKACNLSLMPPTELQGSVLSRSSNPVEDKNSQAASESTDGAQRNQILLQQALPQGAATNILNGPAFIFPMGQQPHAAATLAGAPVRPPNSGNASSGATASSSSMNGSATPAGAPTMSFPYPAMPGNETQYLAILQNNGYPFPVPAHVGPPPSYRGAPGQPMPFFNGSFYPSQMIQPPHLQPQKQQQTGQMILHHNPSNQNGSVSSGSSGAQKHLHNQQLRPSINHGNSQGFPTHKVQSQPFSFQQRPQSRENATQHSKTVGEDRPSTADSRGSLSNVASGQTFGMQMPPPNLGLSSPAPGGGVVGSSNNHGEKKSQQQVSKAGVESFQSQGYTMTFTTINGANTVPALNISSVARNHAMFRSVPEAARQGYQMMAVAQADHQKMNNSAPLGDRKSGSSVAATEIQRKTATGKTSGVNGGQSIAFSNKHESADTSVSAVMSGSIVDSSSRLINLGSALPQNSGSIRTSYQQQQHHMQQNQSQQPYTTMYLQKQQRYASSVAASAARTKGPVASNGSGFPDHNNITRSPGGTTQFANANSEFPQSLVQSSSMQSPQWKNNSPRTTNTAQAQSPSILSPPSSVTAASPPSNISHKQQSRPQQSQISFSANSKPMASGSPMQQVQGATNHQAVSSPVLVGSPSTSSISKNANSIPRTTASASSAANKTGEASSTNHSSSQPSKNLQSASVASSTSGRKNSPVLRNLTTSSGSKSQQQQQQLPKHAMQQQAQFFFSNPYAQAQHHQQQITMSPSGGYYIQRHEQQSGSAATATATCPPITGAVTVTSDPAKAIAAAAAANNMKGGGGMGKTQQQLVPPGFPYAHAVQFKPVDQKQQAGE